MLFCRVYAVCFLAEVGLSYGSACRLGILEFRPLSNICARLTTDSLWPYSFLHIREIIEEKIEHLTRFGKKDSGCVMFNSRSLQLVSIDQIMVPQNRKWSIS